MRYRALRAAALLVACALAGCAGRTPPSPAEGAARIELDAVPFFAQTEHQCGPAALATLLGHAGVPVLPEDLASEIYVPARRGSLQPEIVASIRRHGRVPWRVTGGLGELVAELEAGRPVLVLQNLGISWLPSWHYAVVVGFDRAADAFVLRSGATRRRIERRAIFQRTWQRSDAWGVVALGAGELPTRDDPARLFATLAEMEAVGSRELAAAGYAAMTRRWPDRPDGDFGLGNLALARGEWSAAAVAFRQAIVVSAGRHVAARNNLAVALLELGCKAGAIEEALAARAMLPPDDPLTTAIDDTLAQARARGGPDAPGCGAPAER